MMKRLVHWIWNGMIAMAEARQEYHKKHGFSAWY
jgi:hypothetical protein